MDRALTAEEVKAVLDGSASRLYFGGIVRYRDIYDNSHCTRFMASVGGVELVEQIGKVKSPGMLPSHGAGQTFTTTTISATRNRAAQIRA